MVIAIKNGETFSSKNGFNGFSFFHPFLVLINIINCNLFAYFYHTLINVTHDTYFSLSLLHIYFNWVYRNKHFSACQPWLQMPFSALGYSPNFVSQIWRYHFPQSCYPCKGRFTYYVNILRQPKSGVPGPPLPPPSAMVSIWLTPPPPLVSNGQLLAYPPPPSGGWRNMWTAPK